MIRTPQDWSDHIKLLHTVTNDLAEHVKIVRLMMVGKGISPADSPLVQTRLMDVENKLRMLGANPANPIPFA